MPTPNLSIILPFYKKVKMFKIALVSNRQWFSLPDREVVIALDSPEDETDLLQIVNNESTIKWRVVINRTAHEWRNPAKTLNVGIRNALGTFCHIQSPETIIRNQDIPGMLCREGNVFSTADVVFCRTIGNSDLYNPVRFDSFNYGSLCCKRQMLVDIRGYNEGFSAWGADDDEIRDRLKLTGALHMPQRNLKLYHVEEEWRKLGNKAAYTKPDTAVVNDENWGTDFNEIIFDWNAV